MRRSGGYTLIELMIVVTIMGVLATIATASYTAYVKRAQRGAAQQVMTNIASRQQQYLLDARQYVATIGAGGLGFTSDGWTCAATCVNSRYTITVTVDNAATPPTFAIVGAPLGPQASDGTLNYNSLGQKTRMVGGVDQGW